MSIQKYIKQLKISLTYAYRINRDDEFAKSEARRIYSDSRGMYKSLQSRARKAIAIAKHEGLTLNKPYALKALDNSGKKYICGIVFLDFVPVR